MAEQKIVPQRSKSNWTAIHEQKQLQESLGVCLQNFSSTVEQKTQNNSMRREERTTSFCLHHPIAWLHCLVPTFPRERVLLAIKGVSNQLPQPYGGLHERPTLLSPQAEIGKAETYSDDWGRGRRAGATSMKHIVRVTVVPSGLVCRGFQGLSPLKKPTTNTTTADPLQISLVFAPLLFVFPGASCLNPLTPYSPSTWNLPWQPALASGSA